VSKNGRVRIARLRTAPQRRVEVSDEEQAYLVALRTDRPDLTYTELARMAFRNFGHDRSSTTVRRLLERETRRAAE
jgi:hypothetical protein